jgi:hypothetical protein
LRKGIPISENDRFYLISFLGTLTDSNFIRNPLFSDPETGISDYAPADKH